MAATDRAMAQEKPYIEDVCEQLFLLEVLVDKIDIKTEGLLGSIEKKEEPIEEEEEEEEEEDEDDEEAKRRKEEERRKKNKKKKNTRPIKVKVKFFDFPTIEIDEWDFTEAKDERAMKMDKIKEDEKMDSEEEELLADEEDMTVEEFREKRAKERQELAQELAETMPPGDKFCSGKSCLFPMIPLDLVKAIKKSPLNIQVHRSGDTEQGPRMLGRTSIQLGENFIEAITLASSPTVLPVSAFIDGPYPLKNVFGEITATVHLYVRISCFGNSIFTQFKLKEGEKDYLFKMTGRKLDTAERMNIRKKCGNLAEDDLPKLSPILTKFEDFTVGAKIPVLQKDEPKFQLPISWCKKGSKMPSVNFCPPEKIYKKPQSKPKYRKTITMEHQILRRVIPGFGRQAGDPKFIENNPTLPRLCELKKENTEGTQNDYKTNDSATSSDGSTNSPIKSEEGKSSTKEENKIEFNDNEAPGVKLPCQYGMSWKPIQLPLPRQELYPKMRSFFETQPIPYTTLPTPFQAMDVFQNRKNFFQDLESLNTQETYLKCTCKKIKQSLNQTQTLCDCDTSIKSKFVKVSNKLKPGNMLLKQYAPVKDEQVVTDCLRKKFPIPSDDLDRMVFMFRLDEHFFNKKEKPMKKKKKDIFFKMTIRSENFYSCFGGENYTNLQFNTKLHNALKKMQKPVVKKIKDSPESKLKKDNNSGRTVGIKSGCANIDCKCPCKNWKSNKAKNQIIQDAALDEEEETYRFDDEGETEKTKRMARIKMDRSMRKHSAREKLNAIRNAIEHAQKEEQGKQAWREMIEKKKEEIETVEKNQDEQSVEQVLQPPVDQVRTEEVTENSAEESERVSNKVDGGSATLTIRHHMRKKKKNEKEKPREETTTLGDVKDILRARGKLFDLASQCKDLKEGSKRRVKYINTPGKYPGMQKGHKKCIPGGESGIGIQQRCRGFFEQIEATVKERSEKKKKESKKEVTTDIAKELEHVENETEAMHKISENFVKMAADKLEFNPTLHIHKTNGKYSIVMMPSDPLCEGVNSDERVMFTIDPKHPDRHPDSSSAESSSSDDTSTVSDDSLCIEYTSPLGIYRMNLPQVKHSLAAQTIESALRDEKKRAQDDALLDLESLSSPLDDDENSDDEPFMTIKSLSSQLKAVKPETSSSKKPATPLPYVTATDTQVDTKGKVVLTQTLVAADKKRVKIVEPRLDEQPKKFQPPPMNAQPKTTILKSSKFHEYGYSPFKG